tara:strand:+ start:138 stop:1277 length:1140 start_codon:yes stop_codon:yes gene_type:complete
MSNIYVLGAGMVGSAMAIDLAKKHHVTISDISSDVLSRVVEKEPSLKTEILDVTDTKDLALKIKDADLVLSAVPGFLGFETLKNIILQRKNTIDISFFPENALELNQLALENNVTAIVDCGVAPGMDNVILGYYNQTHDLDFFECLVGGLPKVKKWPFCYKAPFSPVDVIEEYTRPARYIENGELIVRPPLTDCEFVEFDKVGTLESFNSDGLRSIIHTMPHIKNMKEKTLRYPGHVEYIRVLKESGFFHDEPIFENGQSALDVTSKILFKEWKLNENEEELTVMRVTIEGVNKATKHRENISFDLYDEFDHETKISSMARTTGYTATAAVNMYLDGLVSKKGILPPELVGSDKLCYDYFFSYLEERGVKYLKKINRID